MSVARGADGALLAFEVTGDGPPLVLVHGVTDTRRMWDPLIAPLAANHRVVAVDLRGFGESARVPPYDPFTMASDIAAVLDRVGVTNPLVIGHSLGGVVATLFASQFPARGVVNIDQPLEFAGFKAVLATLEPMLRGDETSFRAAMDRITDVLSPSLGAEERLRLHAQPLPEQAVVLAVWDAVLTSSADDLDAVIRDVCARVTVPYLSLLGDDIGDAYEQWLKERIPTATVDVWPGDGHFMHLVEPDRFVARVNEFERTL
jgi:pimeloyl-ACP methyl ester carboxylesterase